MTWIKTNHKKWKWKNPIVKAIGLSEAFSEINFDHEYFSVRDRILTLKPGYAIDGFTAFIDIKSEMDAAGFHDALLQAMDLDYIGEGLTNDIHRVFRDAFRREWLGKALYLGIRAFYPIRQFRKRLF